MPMDTNLFHKPRPGVGGVYSPVPVQSTHDPCMWPRKRKTHLPVRQSLPEHFPVESAIQLLLPYQPLIQSIRTEVGLPESHWQEIYRPVVHHYAELCQRLPYSTTSANPSTIWWSPLSCRLTASNNDGNRSRHRCRLGRTTAFDSIRNASIDAMR